MKDSSYWKQQKFLNYRSNLQRNNGGCPWSASIIALAHALESTDKTSDAVINNFKSRLRMTDDDLMNLLGAWQNKDWHCKTIERFVHRGDQNQ